MFRDERFHLSGAQLLPDTDTTVSAVSSSSMNEENNLDDVFGSAPASPNGQITSGGVSKINTEPSDVPRLRSEHSTSGYRDGLSSGKSTTLQQGFDEGYSLGAVFGIGIGAILGVLEGICTAVQGMSDDERLEKARMKALLETARRELKMEQIFGRPWWGGDGIWTYRVAGEKEDESSEYTFKVVVESHPQVIKWKKIMDNEVERWGLDLKVLERIEAKRLDTDDRVDS